MVKARAYCRARAFVCLSTAGLHPALETMIKVLNITEAVLVRCPVAVAGNGNEEKVCRLVRGQAALVWHPATREQGTLVDVTVVRTMVQTHHDVKGDRMITGLKSRGRFGIDENAEPWVAPLAGSDLIPASDIGKLGALEAPSVQVRARIGKREPAFWASSRFTRGGLEATSWGPIAGTEIAKLLEGGLGDTDNSHESVFAPFLGVLTDQAINDTSREVFVMTGGGVRQWTPIMPATASLVANGTSLSGLDSPAKVALYEKAMELLLAMELPVAIAWENTNPSARSRAMVKLGDNTPRRAVLKDESAESVIRHVIERTATRVAAELDMPELAALASPTPTLSDAFEAFLGTRDGRAAASALNDEIALAAGQAAHDTCPPIWSTVQTDSSNPYMGVVERDGRMLKTALERMAVAAAS